MFYSIRLSTMLIFSCAEKNHLEVDSQLQIVGHGSAIEYSPTGQLAVACCADYGQAGPSPSALCVLEPAAGWRTFDWSQGLLDVCWARNHPDLILTSSMDGSMHLWSSKEAESEFANSKPLQVYKEHSGEVYSIDWTTMNHNPQILSGSWDSEIFIWDLNFSKPLIKYKDTNKNLIFSVNFSGENNNLFCSSGSDGFLKIWSTCEPRPLKSIKVGIEALCCEFSNRNNNLVAVGNEAGIVTIIDIRMDKTLMQIHAGNLAVKDIAFSPHSDQIATAGFDSIARVWDLAASDEELYAICHHKDTIQSISWNPQNPYVLADCGWDNIINIYSLPK